MNSKGLLLLCEGHQEVEPLLGGLLTDLSLRLVTTPNPGAVSALAEEHKPKIIILNIASPESTCHQLKMNSALYYIPLFVIATPSDRDIELQFLSNEFFPKPLQSICLLDKIRSYLESRPDLSITKSVKTKTKERWIEKKAGDDYSFDYDGKLDADQMDIVIKRIAELITVGRKGFTLNLRAASHVENIPLSKFIRLQELIQQAGGHLKLLSRVSTITEELSLKGIDIDEYMHFEDITDK